MNRPQQGQKAGEGLSRPREQHLKSTDLASWGTESLGFSLARAIEGVRGVLLGKWTWSNHAWSWTHRSCSPQFHSPPFFVWEADSHHHSSPVLWLLIAWSQWEVHR